MKRETWTTSTAVVCGLGLLAVAVGASDSATAGARQRRHDVMRGSAVPKHPVIPYGYSFYPHEIEGGVSGNLSFNNQIRKFRDPLNANGGGG